MGFLDFAHEYPNSATLIALVLMCLALIAISDIIRAVWKRWRR